MTRRRIPVETDHDGFVIAPECVIACTFSGGNVLHLRPVEPFSGPLCDRNFGARDPWDVEQLHSAEARTAAHFCPECYERAQELVPDEEPPEDDAFSDCRYCGAAFPGTGEDCGACRLDDEQAEQYARCAHGSRPGECGPCDVAGDLAFDAAREERLR